MSKDKVLSNSEIELLKEENLKLRHDLQMANDELWRVKQLNIALQGTISWRITAPLRYLRSIPSRLRKTTLGRVLYRLKLAKSKFFFRIQQGGGNNLALDRLVSERKHELFSAHHIGRYKRKKYVARQVESLPEIDLSVVTYNNGKWADQFLKSLKSQKFPLKKIHLFIIDNSSADDTYKILLELVNKNKNIFASVTLQLGPNLGFGAGHDAAIACGNSDYILVSNIDVEFEENTIINLVAEAVIDNKNVASWEVRQAPYEHPKYVDPVTLQVNWSSHCAILMRREAYKSVGGYDSSIFMYGEDVELSYRFISKGWKLKYVPDAVLMHYTYKEANEIKPVQFIGSVFANGLIRIRYGNSKDAFAAIMLQLAVVCGPLPIQNAKKILIKNFIRLLAYFPIERIKKIGFRGTFPFRGFDYDMRREGAFYDLSNVKRTGPLVSVITRTYKGRERYLKECIASVINQTYQNIEHIIVEDGGNSHESLIGEVVNLYPDVAIRYFSQEKLGRSAAGNRGLKESSGRWCIFLDDDDLFMHDHIEVLANELQKDNNLSAAYALAWEVKTDILDQGYSEKMYLTEPVFYQQFSQHVLLHHNYIPIQCILFSKTLFENRGGFDESLDQLEDWNLWVKYSINNKFKWVEKTTSIYKTPYSASVATERKKLLDNAYKIVQMKNHEIFKKYNSGM